MKLQLSAKVILCLTYFLIRDEGFQATAYSWHPTNMGFSRRYIFSSKEIQNNLRTNKLGATKLKMELNIENVEATVQDTSSTNSGTSVLNSAALVAGNTIGAGIVALPAVSMQTGFLSSTVLLTALWLYNFLTGLLIAEVCTNMGREKPQVGSLLEIVGQTLGQTGATFASGLSLCLNYLLMVAYVAEGGRYLLEGLNLDSISFLSSNSAIVFTAIMAALMAGSSKLVEAVNNSFCLMLCAAFATLVAVGAPVVTSENLMHVDIASTFSVVPVGVAALVYQNMVPVISNQLDHDEKKVKQALFFGSGMPLLLYIMYDALILGSIPFVAGSGGFSGMNEGPFSLPGFSDALVVFSFSAIVTSFIGSVYSIGAEIKGILSNLEERFEGISNKVSSEVLLYVPPALIASSDSQEIFLSALAASGSLDNALYGILPVAMAWIARYKLDITSSKLVPGGKGALSVLGILATALVFVH